MFLILMNISAFVENSLTKHHWETGGSFRKLHTKGLQWITGNILIKTTDAYPFCESLADSVQYEQMSLPFYRCTRGSIFICVITVCYCYTKVHEWKATEGSIVTYKSLMLPDSIHLDHNLSIPIGSNSLQITQSTTFKIGFYSPGNKQKNWPT